MALIDRFLKEARIGLDAELVVGPKEIIGTITALDAETVTIRQRNGKTAVADLSAIACYEIIEAASEETKPVPEETLTEPAEEIAEVTETSEEALTEPPAETTEETPEDIPEETLTEPAEEIAQEPEAPEKTLTETTEETPEDIAEEAPTEKVEFKLPDTSFLDRYLKAAEEQPEEAEEEPEISEPETEPEEELPEPEEVPEAAEEELPELPELPEEPAPESTPVLSDEEVIRMFNPEHMIHRSAKEEEALIGDIPSFSVDLTETRDYIPKEEEEPEFSAPASVYASPDTLTEPEEEFTDFEKAVIAGSIPAIAALLDVPEHLQAEGLSAADLKRSRKVLDSNTLRSGSDDYSIGCRLDQLQGNLHGAAESFLRKAVRDPENSPNTDKALRRLQTYCIKDRDYVMYTELYDAYKKWITFPTSTELLFHATAYDTVRGNGAEMMEGIPVQFSSETDYLVVIRYLKEHPEAEYLYESIRARLLEDVHYVKASEQLLGVIREQKPEETFEAERRRFFLHLMETGSISELEKLMAVGHEVQETERVYREKNGALAEDAGPRDPKDIVADYLNDSEFGILRAKAYLMRTGEPLSLLDDAAAKLHSRAQEDWNAAAERGDTEAMELLKLVYAETGMPQEEIAALAGPVTEPDTES